MAQHQTQPLQQQAWHTLPEQQLFKALGSDRNGLSTAEAERRLAVFGANEITEENRFSALRLFVGQFTSLVIIILFIAAIVSAVLGEWIDSAVIIAIVILNGIIGFFQEYNAEQSIQALRKMAAPQTRVWRDGQLIVCAAKLITPGDVIALEAGDCIPADARLLTASAFNTIESALTGESAPSEKSTAAALALDTALADRSNMLFMGTNCVHGTGLAMVCATGMNTELGKIAHMLETADQNTQTPLQKNLQDVSKKLVFICLGVVLAIFAIGYFREFPISELFLTSVSLAVAAIPEGLPAVVTVALAVGIQNMVKRQALMRTLPTVETLGSATVICTDKTGTLTVGEMTVREVMQGLELYQVSGEGYAPEGEISAVHQLGTAADHATQEKRPTELLTLLAACNNAKLINKDDSWQAVGDPTEAALLTAAGKLNIWQEQLEQRFPKIGEIPFDSDRKRMSVIRHWDNSPRLLVKGAVDILLGLCSQIEINGEIRSLTESDREQILSKLSTMANGALRVLGAAYKEVAATANPQPELEQDLIWVGMVGMVDPPRSEAKQAIKQCHSAGIKVVMITGDHPVTAAAIAEELLILKPHEKVLSGKELDLLSDEELQKNINLISAFARVTAEHKMRIVHAWQAKQHVVAMTGDGVNDAPAIKAADIGIAMGKSGTEVTKQAADMIITDDNFASIVAAVEEGRGVYANIQKTLQYLLSGNVGELLLVAIAVLTGYPMPLLPVHLLWINLVTDGLPALALATDPIDSSLMQKRPRQSGESMLNRLFFLRMIVTALLTAGTSLFTFIYSLGHHSLEEARTIAFATLVCAELFRAFGVRQESSNLGLFSNPRLLIVVAIGLLIQPWWWPIPALHSLLNCVQLEPELMLLCLGAGLVPLSIIKLLSKFRFWRGEF